jgi:osmoprotectant transport system permease protein
VTSLPLLSVSLRLCVSLFCLLFCSTVQAETITVGSKKFPESYVLAEIAKRQIQNAGIKDVQHQLGLGATGIVWGKLKNGEIGAYPEYTATVSEEILKLKGTVSDAQIADALKAEGIGMTSDLGFDDNYTLVMLKARAQQLGITRISDLKAHPELRVGPTAEFLNRKDGFKSLCQRYGLHFDDVSALEHSLGYAKLRDKQIDLMECYTTDAEIAEYNLLVLDDDLHFFPRYKAVYLYRLDLPPKAIAALKGLEGKISQPTMIRLNGEARKTTDYGVVAAGFFGKEAVRQAKDESESVARYILRLTGVHLKLVGISLFFAILVGIPLGIVASRPGTLGAFILGAVGVIQTIPSLALLAFLIPVPILGKGATTAIVALFLYSLLPIVRNTATGLQTIPPSLRESAAALGLESQAQLTQIFLPMASRTILAGIKTSAIINIGTATLAAFIGSGGLGEPIQSGLSINNNTLILEGAIPAALLALAAQFIFNLLDRLLIPKGLRLPEKTD